MKKHVCQEDKTCCCYQLALEPDEKCPLHGAGDWPPRCETCGRFIHRKYNEDHLLQTHAQATQLGYGA